MSKQALNNRPFFLRLFFLLSLMALPLCLAACQPTVEPSITLEKPTSSPSATHSTGEVINSTPSSLPVTAVALPTAPLTPTAAVTATAAITLNVTTPFTFSTSGQILYIQAEQSDKAGWSLDNDGFVYSIPVNEKGQATAEAVLLSGELPIQWGPLERSPDGSRVLILGGSEAGDLLFKIDPATGQLYNVDTRGAVKFFNWHPNNRQVLVWAASGNGPDSGLWLVDVDNSEKFVLLDVDYVYDNKLGGVRGGVISPDGQTILYSHPKNSGAKDIWLMNSDGSNRRIFMEDVFMSGLTGSPDGRMFAFIGHTDEGSGVGVMNADGSSLRFVSQNFSGGQAFPLLWSPDSQMLAFNGLCEENPAIDATQQPFQFQNNIHIVNVNTGEDYPLLTDGCGNTDPIWSPDSTHLAFASVRSGHSEIWVAAKDGSDLERLTNHEGALVRFPVWLPIYH